MSPNDIDAVLGADAVQNVVDAVTAAMSTARSADRAQVNAAAIELLTSLLAAVIISQPVGAADRSRQCAGRLTEIVEASLRSHGLEK